MRIKGTLFAVLFAVSFAVAGRAIAEPTGSNSAAAPAAGGKYSAADRAAIVDEFKSKYVCLSNNMYIKDSEASGALCPDGQKLMGYVQRMIDEGWMRQDIMDLLSMVKMGRPLVEPTGVQACTTPGKLKLDMFIMSYCPYGVRFVSDVLTPMQGELGDSLDFEPYFIVYPDQSGNLSSMHGQKELDEDFRQVCIREKFGKDAWFKYFKCYSAEIYGNQSAPKDWKYCAGQANIPTADIETCFANDAKNLIKKDMELAQKFEAQGSPTAVYNCSGAIVGAIPYKNIKSEICRMATEPKPAACKKN